MNEEKVHFGSYGDEVRFLGHNFKKEDDRIGELVYRYKELGESEDEIVEGLIENFDFEIADIFLEKIKKEDNEFEVKLLERCIFKNCFYENKNEEKLGYIKQDREIDREDIKEHIAGKKSIAVSILREDFRSNIGIIDIDEEVDFSGKEIKGYIEKTGGKGYHIWYFFDKFYQGDEIEKYLNEIIDKNFQNIKLEIFPKENYLDEKENVIRLPFGRHPKTLNKSEFLNLNSISEIVEEKIIFNNGNFENFICLLKEENEEAYKIVNGCSKIKYILQESFMSLEMEHYKRLVILYTLHFVKNGDNVIHDIMSNMDNYSFNKTEKFINECFDNTISCKKICSYFKRERENLCLCEFKENINYKTPLNLIKEYNGELEKEFEEIIKELSELKKEKSIIERKINKIQRRMNFLFERNQREEIETSMGSLKNKDGEFFLEIRF